MGSETHDDFEYQGYLLFNGLYTVDILDEDYGTDWQSVESSLSEALPSPDADDADQEGYEPLLLREAIYDQDLPEELETVTDALIPLRYQYEKRDEEREAYYGGDRVTVDLISRRDADLYWKYPDYAFFRGSQEDVQQLRENVRQHLTGRVSLSPLELSSDFLLWLYYQQQAGNNLAGPISIERLTDAELTGDQDAFGGSSAVEDSTNLEQSVPVIAAILRNKQIAELEGRFRIVGNSVGAKLQTDSVHVKASYGDIANANDVRRMAITLRFLEEFSELKNHWETLDDTDKYPPLGFFQDLRSAAQNQGIDIQETHDEVLRRYAEKRGEDWGV